MYGSGDVVASIAGAVLAGQRNGVVVQDADGRIIDFNDAALLSLAMTADQLLGVSSLDERWQAVDAAGVPLVGDRHPAMVALERGEPQLGQTIGVRSGDGETRWLLVDSVLIDHDTLGCLVVSQFLDKTIEHNALHRMTEALDRLQRHVLPGGDVDLGWISAHHRYESVTPPLDIGGDFLDVVPLENGDAAFFIGDVAGHDLNAVATMVIARHTLRAASLHLRRPGRVLQWLHDTVSATPDTVYCTVIFGVAAHQPDGSVAVRLANGGHPPPIHITDDRAAVVDGSGMLVGAPIPWTEPPEVTVRLEPGDELLLYTDGLLENPRPRIDHEQLRMHLDGMRRRRRPAIEAIGDLLDSPGRRHFDDTAILVLTAQ